MENRDLILSQIRQRLEILYQIVEELEREPGPTPPGPGGTTDYNDLTNKPQIEGATLSGNKTAAQLGLATSSSVSSITSRFEDLITPDNIEVEDDGELPSSVDSRLALHQPIMLNHAIYYCYDESGVDYTYVALDTSGAYPKLSYAQIFKENKRVHFYDYATDTVPASNSDNFITSGGVYTALTGKADSSSVYTKTEVDTALASKQNSLDTAQLNAVNSGITSSKVAQYDKDAAVLPEIVNGGAKNLSPVDSGTNGTTRYAEIAISIPAGTYIVYCGNLTSNDTDSTTCLVRFYDANGTQVSTPTSAKIARGNGVYITITVSNATNTLRIYPSDTSALSENDTVSFTGLMVCTKAAWDISQAYEPYATTNRELYMSKIEILDVFGRGTAIQSNTDLNDITQIGRYYSLDSSVSGTLTNAPITTSGFVMSVENNYQSSGGNTGVIQTATITGSSSVIVYKRAYRASGGVWGWTPWIKFEGTVGT